MTVLLEKSVAFLLGIVNTDFHAKQSNIENEKRFNKSPAG